jgi:hypothetical protein
MLLDRGRLRRGEGGIRRIFIGEEVVEGGMRLGAERVEGAQGGRMRLRGLATTIAQWKCVQSGLLS